MCVLSSVLAQIDTTETEVIATSFPASLFFSSTTREAEEREPRNEPDGLLLLRKKIRL